jgi:hypothetical protein
VTDDIMGTADQGEVAAAAAPDEGAQGEAAEAAAAPREAPREAPKWQERDAWSAVVALNEAPVLVPAREWPGDVEGLDRPGLYGWWVDEAGAADLARVIGIGGRDELAAGRLVIGQAGATKWPSGRTVNDTLGQRIGETHLGGKVRMSTFRWTLAAILFDQLGLQGQAAMLLTPPSEQALSGWMREHLSIAVHPHDDRDSLEGLRRELLAMLDPPLNLRHVPATALRTRVTELRRRISREA